MGPAVDRPDDRYSGLGGALRVCAGMLHNGVTPLGEMRGNVLSPARVGAALDSADRC